ncbi:MAG: hypothetical protein BGO28_01115 [Alphaproteobacteria bacterium 43-37]|nr:MAG: hypothetical protein BGO28_01115 [Alphaproteobacteria bacterium 43-37]
MLSVLVVAFLFHQEAFATDVSTAINVPLYLTSSNDVVNIDDGGSITANAMVMGQNSVLRFMAPFTVVSSLNYTSQTNSSIEFNNGGVFFGNVYLNTNGTIRFIKPGSDFVGSVVGGSSLGAGIVEVGNTYILGSQSSFGSGFPLGKVIVKDNCIFALASNQYSATQTNLGNGAVFAVNGDVQKIPAFINGKAFGNGKLIISRGFPWVMPTSGAIGNTYPLSQLLIKSFGGIKIQDPVSANNLVMEPDSLLQISRGGAVYGAIDGAASNVGAIEITGSGIVTQGTVGGSNTIKQLTVLEGGSLELRNPVSVLYMALDANTNLTINTGGCLYSTVNGKRTDQGNIIIQAPYTIPASWPIGNIYPVNSIIVTENVTLGSFAPVSARQIILKNLATFKNSMSQNTVYASIDGNLNCNGPFTICDGTVEAAESLNLYGSLGHWHPLYKVVVDNGKTLSIGGDLKAFSAVMENGSTIVMNYNGGNVLLDSLYGSSSGSGNLTVLQSMTFTGMLGIPNPINAVNIADNVVFNFNGAYLYANKGVILGSNSDFFFNDIIGYDYISTTFDGRQDGAGRFFLNVLRMVLHSPIGVTHELEKVTIMAGKVLVASLPVNAQQTRLESGSSLVVSSGGVVNAQQTRLESGASIVASGGAINTPIDGVSDFVGTFNINTDFTIAPNCPIGMYNPLYEVNVASFENLIVNGHLAAQSINLNSGSVMTINNVTIGGSIKGDGELIMNGVFSLDYPLGVVDSPLSSILVLEDSSLYLHANTYSWNMLLRRDGSIFIKEDGLTLDSPVSGDSYGCGNFILDKTLNYHHYIGMSDPIALLKLNDNVTLNFQMDYLAANQTLLGNNATLLLAQQSVNLLSPLDGINDNEGELRFSLPYYALFSTASPIGQMHPLNKISIQFGNIGAATQVNFNYPVNASLIGVEDRARLSIYATLTGNVALDQLGTLLVGTGGKVVGPLYGTAREYGVLQVSSNFIAEPPTTIGADEEHNLAWVYVDAGKTLDVRAPYCVENTVLSDGASLIFNRTDSGSNIFIGSIKGDSAGHGTVKFVTSYELLRLDIGNIGQLIVGQGQNLTLYYLLQAYNSYLEMGSRLTIAQAVGISGFVDGDVDHHGELVLENTYTSTASDGVPFSIGSKHPLQNIQVADGKTLTFKLSFPNSDPPKVLNPAQSITLGQNSVLDITTNTNSYLGYMDLHSAVDGSSENFGQMSISGAARVVNFEPLGGVYPLFSIHLEDSSILWLKNNISAYEVLLDAAEIKLAGNYTIATSSLLSQYQAATINLETYRLIVAGDLSFTYDLIGTKLTGTGVNDLGQMFHNGSSNPDFSNTAIYFSNCPTISAGITYSLIKSNQVPTISGMWMYPEGDCDWHWGISVDGSNSVVITATTGKTWYEKIYEKLAGFYYKIFYQHSAASLRGPTSSKKYKNEILPLHGLQRIHKPQEDEAHGRLGFLTTWLSTWFSQGNKVAEEKVVTVRPPNIKRHTNPNLEEFE